MTDNTLQRLELNLIYLSLSSTSMEEKSRKMREILTEYNMDIQMAKYKAYHDGKGNGWHDGYFGGYAEGLAEGTGEEWQEIE